VVHVSSPVLRFVVVKSFMISAFIHLLQVWKELILFSVVFP
jgi:hypothetical protein